MHVISKHAVSPAAKKKRKESCQSIKVLLESFCILGGLDISIEDTVICEKMTAWRNLCQQVADVAEEQDRSEDDPCGKPDVTGADADDSPSTSTFWLLKLRKLCI